MSERKHMPCAKSQQARSYRNDISRVKPILAFCGKMKMADISPFLIEESRRQLLNTAGGAEAAGGRRLDQLPGHLFVSPRSGGRLKSLKSAWKNACKAAGIRKSPRE